MNIDLIKITVEIKTLSARIDKLNNLISKCVTQLIFLRKQIEITGMYNVQNKPLIGLGDSQ